MMPSVKALLRRAPDTIVTSARRDPNTAGETAIEARAVTVVTRGNTLVKDVSLICPAGQVVGIIGPNGAGKTTLLRTMAGLTKPTNGHVAINGVPVHSMTTSETSQRIAYVPQSAAVHPFTAIDMVLMGRYPYLRRWQLEAAEDRRAAHEALTQTDTAQFANRRVDTLSGGERQRVLIARAIAQDTDVILADEPVASLDLKHQLLTLRLLRERAKSQQVAVCVVMHDLNLAASYCDNVLAMHQGSAVASGTPNAVLTPELIQQVFQVNATIDTNPDGTPSIRVNLT